MSVLSSSPAPSAPASEAPIIFSRGVAQRALGIGARMLAGLISLACLAVLIVAAIVRPSPAGYGTHHDSLGLNSCEFMARTGLPCPSCGMTTSFAWFVRGNVVASFYVQPMGMVLALLTAAMVWAAAYVAITGKPVHRLIRLLPTRTIVMALLAFAIAAWAWKIMLHVNGWDGWN